MRAPARLLLAVLSLAAAFPTAAARDACLDCHMGLPGAAGTSGRGFESSVHRQFGLTCADCHGGDSRATRAAEAKDRRRGYIGVPGFADIPQMCGRCHASVAYMKQYNPAAHTDQVDQYRTSRHGLAAARGDTRVATCTSCHSVHDIRRTGDPLSPVHRIRLADTCGRCHSDPVRMRDYGLPADTVTRYKASPHALAVFEGNAFAPTCSDCHGDHGAVPPAATSVANVCGNCHIRQRELFAGSTHASVFASRNLQGCVACHETHAPDPASRSFLQGIPLSCAGCHDSGEPARICEQWVSEFSSLDERVRFAGDFLRDADRAGVDVRASVRLLSIAAERLAAARTAVHALDPSRVAGILEEGSSHAAQAYTDAMRGIEELQERSHAVYLILGFIGTTVAFGGILLARSIAARRREAEALREERARVQESRERLARVGEISTGLAHTIRNPLHGVLNCVDILRSKLPSDETTADILGLMNEGLRRIQGVTQRLLVLTRETPLEKTPTDVTGLIQDALRFVEVRCHNAGLAIERDFRPLPPLQLDPNQFTEALLNVLDNAIDGSPQGGAITIRTLPSHSSREEARIEIADTGNGIPPEQLPKVFDPFHTSKAIGEGTGLGLAITRRIIERHDGRVEIESELGRGTTVIFHLPILEGGNPPD